MYSLPEEDLKMVFESVKGFWPRQKIFLITGGTGFFGRWLVESIAYIERSLNTENKYVILTRQKKSALIQKINVFSLPIFEILTGDIDSPFSLSHKFDYVLHAASDVAKIKSAESSDFSAIVMATGNLLNAIQMSEKGRFLYVSSGGVYESNANKPTEEAALVQLDGHVNTYAKAKLESEKLVSALKHYRIARCFSFLGPFADSKMVSMDMIGRKIENSPIVVKSPEVVRSFMYPSDLTVCLLRLLLSSTKESTYNIGSDQPISLLELAQKISALHNHSEVQIQNQTGHSLAGSYYCPDTTRYDSEFGTSLSVELDQVLLKTFNFLSQRRSA